MSSYRQFLRIIIEEIPESRGGKYRIGLAEELKKYESKTMQKN